MVDVIKVAAVRGMVQVSADDGGDAPAGSRLGVAVACALLMADRWKNTA